MKLDLDHPKSVQVRPVLFVVKDRVDRIAMLILDLDRYEHLLYPSPNGEGTDVLKCGSDPLFLSSYSSRQADGRTVLRLNHDSAPALELRVPPRLIEFFRSGGEFRWRRPRSGRQAGRNTRHPGPRSVELIAILFQDVELPTISHLVSPDPKSAGRFQEIGFRGPERMPYHLIEDCKIVLEPSRSLLRFNIVAIDLRGRPSRFRGTLRLNPIGSGPLSPERNRVDWRAGPRQRGPYVIHPQQGPGCRLTGSPFLSECRSG